MKKIVIVSFVCLSIFMLNKSFGQEEITVQGKFSSVKGVMNNLSCYCYNSGYLTTKSGDKIAICFEDDEIKVKSIDNLEVTGYYKTKKIKDSGPCPAGERKLLIVTSYQCPDKNKNQQESQYEIRYEDADGLQSFSGSFRSIRGVMTKLSTYCYNGGYLTTASGDEVTLCFDDDVDVECTELTVTGKYGIAKNSSGGEIEVFYVETFECK